MMRRFLASTVLLVVTATSAAAQAPTIVEKDAVVLGFRLHYLEAGRGAPVVLLHGLGGDGSRWAPNIGALAAAFHVVALDQIGFGQSDKPLANYHTGMLAEFLVGFMKAIGMPKASLVGNSMGANVAAYTAVHYPDAVERLILVDGAGYARAPDAPAPSPHLRQIQNGVTREETREFFRIMLHEKSLVTDAMVDDNLALRLRSAVAITKMLDAGRSGIGSLSDDDMRTVKAPTLVVWGKYDELAGPPERTAERLHHDIPGAQLVVIDDAGHLPQLEQTVEFNRVVTEFLKIGAVEPRR